MASEAKAGSNATNAIDIPDNDTSSNSKLSKKKLKRRKSPGGPASSSATDAAAPPADPDQTSSAPSSRRNSNSSSSAKPRKTIAPTLLSSSPSSSSIAKVANDPPSVAHGGGGSSGGSAAAPEKPVPAPKKRKISPTIVVVLDSDSEQMPESSLPLAAVPERIALPKTDGSLSDSAATDTSGPKSKPKRGRPPKDSQKGSKNSQKGAKKADRKSRSASTSRTPASSVAPSPTSSNSSSTPKSDAPLVAAAGKATSKKGAARGRKEKPEKKRATKRKASGSVSDGGEGPTKKVKREYTKKADKAKKDNAKKNETKTKKAAKAKSGPTSPKSKKKDAAAAAEDAKNATKAKSTKTAKKTNKKEEKDDPKATKAKKKSGAASKQENANPNKTAAGAAAKKDAKNSKAAKSGGGKNAKKADAAKAKSPSSSSTGASDDASSSSSDKRKAKKDDVVAMEDDEDGDEADDEQEDAFDEEESEGVVSGDDNDSVNAENALARIGRKTDAIAYDPKRPSIFFTLNLDDFVNDRDGPIANVSWTRLLRRKAREEEDMSDDGSESLGATEDADEDKSDAGGADEDVMVDEDVGEDAAGGGEGVPKEGDDASKPLSFLDKLALKYGANPEDSRDSANGVSYVSSDDESQHVPAGADNYYDTDDSFIDDSEVVHVKANIRTDIGGWYIAGGDIKVVEIAPERRKKGVKVLQLRVRSEPMFASARMDCLLYRLKHAAEIIYPKDKLEELRKDGARLASSLAPLLCSIGLLMKEEEFEKRQRSTIYGKLSTFMPFDVEGIETRMKRCMTKEPASSVGLEKDPAFVSWRFVNARAQRDYAIKRLKRKAKKMNDDFKKTLAKHPDTKQHVDWDRFDEDFVLFVKYRLHELESQRMLKAMENPGKSLPDWDTEKAKDVESCFSRVQTAISKSVVTVDEIRAEYQRAEPQFVVEFDYSEVMKPVVNPKRNRSKKSADSGSPISGASTASIPSVASDKSSSNASKSSSATSSSAASATSSSSATNAAAASSTSSSANSSKKNDSKDSKQSNSAKDSKS